MVVLLGLSKRTSSPTEQAFGRRYRTKSSSTKRQFHSQLDQPLYSGTRSRLRSEGTENNMKRKIEAFSAGCPVCENTIEVANRIACPSCEVEMFDMRKSDVVARARHYGVKNDPARV